MFVNVTNTLNSTLNGRMVRHNVKMVMTRPHMTYKHIIKFKLHVPCYNINNKKLKWVTGKAINKIKE